MNKWFGMSWGAPWCEPDTHVATPVGRPCIGCAAPIKAEDQGHIIPMVGWETPDGCWHRACFMDHLGLSRFPAGYGKNYRRPVVNVRHGSLTLDDPDDNGYRVRCPVCHDGVMRVQRDPQTLRLIRHDYCSKCVQRFWYTDTEIAGEMLPGIGQA